MGLKKVGLWVESGLAALKTATIMVIPSKVLMLHNYELGIVIYTFIFFRTLFQKYT